MKAVKASAGSAARPRWLAACAYAAPTFILLTLSAILLSSRGLILHRYFHDIFVVFDAMWRAREGLTPHIDFPSPIGQAYYWPFALLARLGDTSPSTLLRANVLVAAFVAVLAYLSLPRRLSPLLFALAFFTAITVALTPRDPDGGIETFAFLAPYNSWAWSLVTVPALLALVPPRAPPSKIDILIDGVVLGVSISLLVYLKVTFGAMAIALTIVGLSARQVHLLTVVWAAAVALAIAATIQVLANNNLAYLSDIQAASAVNLHSEASVRSSKLVKQIILSGGILTLFISTLLLLKSRIQGDRGVWARIIVATGSILLANALISAQNHSRVQVTLLGIAVIAGAELVWRSLAGKPPRSFRNGTKLGIASTAMMLLVVVLAGPLLDAASIVAHARESHEGSTCLIPAMVGLSDELRVPPLAQRENVGGPKSCGWINTSAPSAFQPGSAAPTSNSIDRKQMGRVRRFQDGLQLVRAYATPSDRILAGDFSNPYPMLLNARSPLHAPIWWDYGRNFDSLHHPAPEPLFASTTLFMEASSEDGRELWRIYQPAIERDFVLIAQSRDWRLWRRRVQSGSNAARSAVKVPAEWQGSASSGGVPSIRSGATRP